MDYNITIPIDIFRMIEGLLANGKLDYQGKFIDLSEVQTITIADGKLRFSPPAKISAKIGPVRVNTTITTIENLGDGIHINIDNSPIDLELKPE